MYTNRETNKSKCAVSNDEPSSSTSGAVTSEANDQTVNSVCPVKPNRKFVCYFGGGNKWHPCFCCPVKNET